MLENHGFGLLVGCGCGAVLNGRGVVLGGWGVGRRGGILSGGVGVFVYGCFL